MADINGLSSVVIPGALIVVSSAATMVVTSYFRRKDEQRRAVEKRDDDLNVWRSKVTALELELKVLKESVTPISMAFQQILIKELTHFHEVRTDELLAKIGPPYMLSDEDEVELLAALDKRIVEAGDLMTDTERDAARMLPMLIKRVKAELAMGIPPPIAAEPELKLVTVPAATSSPP